MQAQLTRLQQSVARERDAQKMKEIKRKRKREEMEKVGKGKNPFYLKRSELQKEFLEEKFEDLQKSGRLVKTLEKRRRRNAAKDRLKLPYEQRDPEKSRGGGGKLFVSVGKRTKRDHKPKE